ncbi:hypothetical protein GBZ48_23355 [Azospirillum melinis]|uniref:Glycosyltransferase RgtA/B/C/D-like domain-containing protein n=1 Tax=Azospirillum melinis TaxID=328839 RepID=A0ABX2KK81_9PROT|nr:hypothetical protein [Azospirillum melinis]MBP2307020.1 hypothetical protein [Azospirillum melinis]NUB02183.1 hypothetical protein [Azospirillum melinis]
MPSLSLAALCAATGLVLWMASGYALARSLAFDRAIALTLAPVLGWAVQNALALLLSLVGGFSPVATVGAMALVCAAGLLRVRRDGSEDRIPPLTLWVCLATAVMAAGPALAVLPKFTGDGIAVAPALFDHAKIALIDQIVREGVPPVNPVYGGAEAPAGVAYYYLWQFGAAQLAQLTGATGWEADAAASWLTAFSTLLLMAGLARHFSGSSLAPFLAIGLSGLGSLRPVLVAMVGEETLEHWLQPATGLAGWLFQTSWSPHHVQAAGCVVVAVMTMVRLARRPGALTTVTLALLAAAAYQSSIWVGGVVFVLAAAGCALFLARSRPARSHPAGGVGTFLLLGSVAAVVAVAIASPLLVEQYRSAVARGGGRLIAIDPFEVLGPALPQPLGRVLDVPAYWLVLLVVEFPLVYLAGAIALARMAARPDARPDGPPDGLLVRALAILTAASLGAGWLLVSTAGVNNDLGWRAVLPGLMVLTAAAGAGLARCVERRAALPLVLAMAAATATLPDGLRLAAENLAGRPSSSAAAFARSPALWQAVRRHAPPDARVASNPALFADMTPWPVNLSWALFADRRSCFAGNELAIAFAALQSERRAAIAEQFGRVFAGDGTPDDIRALAWIHRCDVVVVTVFDGAWSRDPFAASPLYRLAEAEPGLWRIYSAGPRMAGD